MYFRILVTFLLMLVLTVVQAASGEQQLRAFINDLDSLKSNFTQQLMNESGELLETSHGELYLQRPGKFNWQYTEPYVQQILTDGRTLWIHDEDLEQVTIRRMQQGLQATPAAILGGNADIDELYEIVELGELEGYQWVRLKPLEDDNQYSDIRIGFDDGKLGMMIMSDNLGQTTRIDFSDVEINVRIDPDRFEFELPEGADVIDDRQQ